MPSLFLSYRRSDSPGTVKQLYECLQSRLPRWTLFYDHRTLAPGEDFPERLRQEVTTAKVVLVVIGPRWAELLRQRRGRPEVDHVREEVRLALQAGNVVIPVLVENAPMPREVDLADFLDLLPLRRLNGRALRPDPDFDTDLERLAAFLDELGPGVGPGTVLAGKYKILRAVGQGGMGIVYEAEQLQPRRHVAVKMVLEGMDTKEVLARFDGEKEALARLDHPNIARVIDSGSSPSGKPFFVMEFVKGEPITSYCDHKRLSPDERLNLFRDVCAAVQHAHQKGIIHRDMKPSNVLVEEIDGKPVPKVIDFGLAKALAGRLTDRTLVSELGKTVGTLIYASPELAAGRQYDIDTRTDVYSLGVILYELLVGEPPFTEGDLLQVGEEAMRREIVETEPSKPSNKLSSSKALATIAAQRQLDTAKLMRKVRGELDWIVMKALEKEPDHRYATPNAFADDLQRYLNNEPISVGRPSTLFRLRKFARRNRVPVIAGSLVFAALVIGVIGTTWGLFEAKRQETLAQEETRKKNAALEQEEAQRKLAEQRFAEKRQAMDQILEQFSDRQLNALPGTQEIRKVLFSRGVEQYESMFRENQTDRYVQRNLVERYLQLGRLQSEIGSLTEALEPLRKAEKAIREYLNREPDNKEYQSRLGVTLFQIGYCHWEHSVLQDALPPLREALAIFSRLSQKDPTDYEAALNLALVQARLAASIIGAPAERDSLLKTAYESLRRLVAERPDDNRARVALARVSNYRAGAAMDRDEFGAAEPLYEEARALLAKAVETDPYDAVAFTTYQFVVAGLAKVYSRTNRLDKGIERLQQAVTELTRQARANPAVSLLQKALAYTHDELHKLLRLQGRFDQAIESLRESARIAEYLANKDPRETQYAVDITTYTSSLASLLSSVKKETEAISVYDRLIQQAEGLIELHPQSEPILQNLLEACWFQGGLLMQIHHYDKANHVYQAGVDFFNRYAKPAMQTPVTLRDYLQCCSGLFQVANENKDAAKAVDIAERMLLPFPIEKLDYLEDTKQELLGTWASLSQILEEAGKVAEALRMKERIHQEAKKILGPNVRSNWYLYQYVFGAYHHLARLYRKTGDEEKEFQALRNYFSETEPYTRETDYSALLQATDGFSKSHLELLRAEHDRVFDSKGMKRFTVPVDFNGIKFPFNIYVTESWNHFEDQVTWVEKVRGGKFPKEVVESFHRLYKIAKENNVALTDLSVYALSTASKTDARLQDSPLPRDLLGSTYEDPMKSAAALAEAKKQLRAGGNAPLARKRFAMTYFGLAATDIAAENYFRASFLLEDARGAISIDSFGRLQDPAEADVYAYYQFLRGAMLAGQGELALGYEAIQQSRKASSPANPEFSIPVGKPEFALGWICSKQRRPVESIAWYRRAVELGLSLAAIPLFEVVNAEPEMLKMLSSAEAKAVAEAKKAATKEENPARAFARIFPKYLGASSLIVHCGDLVDALQETDTKPSETAGMQKLAAAYEQIGDDLLTFDLPESSSSAVYYYRKALAPRERFVESSGKSPASQRALALTYLKLGKVFREKKENAKDALEYTQKSLLINQRLCAADSKDSDSLLQLVLSQYNLGVVQSLRSDVGEAIAAFEKTLAAAPRYEKPQVIADVVADAKKRLAALKDKKEQPSQVK
jgi:serine/threonine protein kinase